MRPEVNGRAQLTGVATSISSPPTTTELGPLSNLPVKNSKTSVSAQNVSPTKSPDRHTTTTSHPKEHQHFTSAVDLDQHNDNHSPLPISFTENLVAKNHELTTSFDTLRTKAKAKILDMQNKLTKEQEEREAQSLIISQLQAQIQQQFPHDSHDNMKLVVEQLQLELASHVSTIDQLRAEVSSSSKAATTIEHGNAKVNGASNDPSHAEQLRQFSLKYNEVDAKYTEVKDALNHSESERKSLESLMRELEESSNLILTEKNGQIATMSNALKQLQLQHLQQLPKLQTTIEEKDKMISALEKQIEGLHKSTMVLRTKEQEIYSLSTRVKELESSNKQLSRHSADLIEEQKKIVDANATQLQALQSEKKFVEVELEQRTDSVNAFVIQLNDHMRLQQQHQDLAASVHESQEQLRLRSAELDASNSALQQQRESTQSTQRRVDELLEFEQLFEAAKSHAEDVTARHSALSVQHDVLRQELSEKENFIHQQRLEFDRLKEDEAGLVARLECNFQDVKAQLHQKTLISRTLESELTQLKSERDTLHQSWSGAKHKHEQLAASLASLQQQHSVEVDQLTRSLSDLTSALQTQQDLCASQKSQISTLDATLTTRTSSQPVNTNSVDSEQYRSIEQENVRLRDRSMRAERFLAELQQHVASLSHSNQDIYKDVVSLTWLESKTDDSLDGEDLESGTPHFHPRPPHLNNSGVLLHHSDSPLPVFALRVFMRKHFRTFLRFVDRKRFVVVVAS